MSFGTGRQLALGVAALSLLGGCALFRQVMASPGDLEDYRAYRTAAHEGRRLFEAQRYLARHPDGTWAREVSAAFDVEEASWFEAAKTSRARAREYLVDLPNGPHVEAARALLVLFDEHQDDTETLVLLAQARHTAALLDYEGARRAVVSATVLADVGALLDGATWGARLDAPPAPLAAVLRGAAPSTWGASVHARRHDDLFFVVPTPAGSEARVADVTFQLWLEGGRVARGLVLGDDLWVRWAEALLLRVLDPANAGDRHLAAVTVADVLGGAFEATLPAARCAASPQPGELLARQCDGWAVSVRMGAAAGTEDAVSASGPLQVGGARPPGMR